MCHKIKKILIRESRRISRQGGSVVVVTRCPHDIVTRYVGRKDDYVFGGFYSKAGWTNLGFQSWPPEVQKFAKTGLFPPARPKKPAKSLIERRAAKTAKLLSTWKRRLKLAQTKVKHYSQKMKRYDKVLPNASFENLVKHAPKIEL